MVKTNRRNGVKDKKVKLGLYKVSRGVFFAVHHICCTLQQVCTCMVSIYVIFIVGSKAHNELMMYMSRRLKIKPIGSRKICGAGPTQP